MNLKPAFLRATLSLYIVKHLLQHLLEHVLFGLAAHPLVHFIQHTLHL